jgi:hypothetical protein
MQQPLVFLTPCSSTTTPYMIDSTMMMNQQCENKLQANNVDNTTIPSPRQVPLSPTTIITPICSVPSSSQHVVLNPSQPITMMMISPPASPLPMSPLHPQQQQRIFMTSPSAMSPTRPQMSSVNADIARKLKSKYSESTLREAKIFKKRKGYPKHITAVLLRWYEEHENYPYPSQQEKEYLSSVTGLSVHQLSTWFSNTRIRTKRREQKLKNQKVVADKKKKKKKTTTTTTPVSAAPVSRPVLAMETFVPCVYYYDPSYYTMQQQQQQPLVYPQQQQPVVDDVFLKMEEVDCDVSSEESLSSPDYHSDDCDPIDSLMQEDVYHGSCNLLESEEYHTTLNNYFN